MAINLTEQDFLDNAWTYLKSHVKTQKPQIMEHRKSTSYTQTDCEEDYWSCVLRRKIISETYVRQIQQPFFK